MYIRNTYFILHENKEMSFIRHMFDNLIRNLILIKVRQNLHKKLW